MRVMVDDKVRSVCLDRPSCVAVSAIQSETRLPVGKHACPPSIKVKIGIEHC